MQSTFDKQGQGTRLAGDSLVPCPSDIRQAEAGNRTSCILSSASCNFKMPKKEKKQENSTKSSTAAKQSTESDEYLQGSPQNSSSECYSPLREETPIVQRGKKRLAEQIQQTDESEDFGQGIHKMLECFGTDYIKNAMQNKKKRLEQLTQSALKSSSKAVDEIWRMQNHERTRLQDEYSKQVSVVFQQWESDLDKTKEQEEKLTLLFKQQQKLFQQARAVQSQRLKTIKQLHSQFIQGVEDLEQSHKTQATNAQAELKKEMNLLQKKILMDTQQQEMANVRKSLQSMLF